MGGEIHEGLAGGPSEGTSNRLRRDRQQGSSNVSTRVMSPFSQGLAVVWVSGSALRLSDDTCHGRHPSAKPTLRWATGRWSIATGKTALHRHAGRVRVRRAVDIPDRSRTIGRSSLSTIKIAYMDKPGRFAIAPQYVACGAFCREPCRQCGSATAGGLSNRKSAARHSRRFESHRRRGARPVSRRLARVFSLPFTVCDSSAYCFRASIRIVDTTVNTSGSRRIESSERGETGQPV